LEILHFQGLLNIAYRSCFLQIHTKTLSSWYWGIARSIRHMIWKVHFKSLAATEPIIAPFTRNLRLGSVNHLLQVRLKTCLYFDSLFSCFHKGWTSLILLYGWSFELFASILQIPYLECYLLHSLKQGYPLLYLSDFKS
jgi:hypothetical protein